MLEQAGIGHSAVPADVDEAREKARNPDARPLTTALARMKAVTVSSAHADQWVIGSDSGVGVDGRLFDKPADREQAAEHLRFFSGKTMVLTSAVALARGGQVDWTHCDEARLQVRQLSDAFIQDYLDAEWPEVGYCVGVFRLEGRGVQLFDAIDGDYFTILGMPLMRLLGALRERGEIPS